MFRDDAARTACILGDRKSYMVRVRCVREVQCVTEM